MIIDHQHVWLGSKDETTTNVLSKFADIAEDCAGGDGGVGITRRNRGMTLLG